MHHSFAASHVGEEAIVKQEIKAIGLFTELSKKQLQQKAENSPIARRALSQWNRMNTTIRGIVNNMQVWLDTVVNILYIIPQSQ